MGRRVRRVALNSAPPSFAALRHPGFRVYFFISAAAMMADSIEHVITYWVLFKTFHSPQLQGVAVIAHWLPFLLFSVPMGALADRVDPRRLIQIGMLLFMSASLTWALLILTGTLQIWHAWALLIVHGLAGVFWGPPSQLLIHYIVGPQQLQSAVRLNATARNLGLLGGPAVGGLMMLAFGATGGLFLNMLFFLPLLLWLWRAPYGPGYHLAGDGEARPRAMVRGGADVLATLRAVRGNRTIVAMVLLGGGAALLIGNAYQAQMPGFGHDLGLEEFNVWYTLLLVADAAGALLAGVILESRNLLRARPATACVLALSWCVTLGIFALTRNFAFALLLLLATGFLELSFNSMAQTLVQLQAPAAIRGRVIGLYNMANNGLRTVSGVSIGLAGGLFGIHASLGFSAALLGLLVLGVLRYVRLGAEP